MRHRILNFKKFIKSDIELSNFNNNKFFSDLKLYFAQYKLI